jgi:outer membrane protein OmpA-like peptidoglycan-associated protein
VTAILKKVGVVGALAMAVSMAAGAQLVVRNNSDFLMGGMTNATTNGFFAPGEAGNRNRRGGGNVTGNISAGVAAYVMNALNSGSICSPLTRNNITGAPASNLAALMNGSPSGVTSVTNALTGSGAPAGPVNELVEALNGLGNNPSLGRVITASQKFNALVANAGTPNSALNSPQLLAIHAALTALVGPANSFPSCQAPPPPPAPAPQPAPAPPPAPRPPPPPPAPARREMLTLRGAHFAFDKSTLTAAAKDTLGQAVRILKEHPEASVEIQGHTDSVGTVAYNQALSERRANSVKEYLASQGIAESRITTRGFGKSQPTAENRTAEGRAENRRVVIIEIP